MSKIGVFDSGVGGKAVVNAIQKEMPELSVLYIDDAKNLPYGNKTPKQLLELVIPKLNELENAGCEVILVACNTVTTTIIKEVRDRIKVPIVAVEPMVKPAAALTKTKTIAVCATPTTLNSSRYRELLDLYAKHLTVLEPDCSDWVYLIEKKAADRTSIKDRIKEVCAEGADVIVLGCTHYHWIEEEIEEIAKGYDAKVIQPEAALVAQLKRVLKQLP
ncbi:MAG TPA: glutamate racemase [Candidatus Saccharimonadales bacterium]|nr:glutamate racemase [Candidatus Saccharimonadales bacterium]